MVKTQNSKLREKIQAYRFSWRDFPALLIFAFILLQLSNFIFFTDPINSLAPAAVPAESLGWQLLIFVLALSTAIYLRIFRWETPLWLLTIPLLALYALILDINSQNLCLNFAVNLLSLVLLFSLRNYRSFDILIRKINKVILLVLFIFSLGKGILLFSQIDTEDLETFFSTVSIETSFLLIVLVITIALYMLYNVIQQYLENKYENIDLLQIKKDNSKQIIAYVIFIVGLGLAVILMSRTSIFKVLGFGTPTFDYGLFRQMFEYMRRTGQPLTTLERDGLYSHFNVHFSPIFYFLLPVYALFPHSVTLNLAQVLIVASAAIPVYMLARTLKFTKFPSLLFSGLYLMQTAIILGSHYDIHESCFYAPLVVWWFYSIFRRNLRFNFFLSILFLMVKEDAALFLISAALFLFFSTYFKDNKYRYYALSLIILAALSFLLISTYLNSMGDGVMTYRFEAMQQYGGNGILGIVRSLFQNFPGFLNIAFAQDKLPYLLATFGGTGFLSLLQKDKSNYILFLPLLVMNLATHYQYQFNYFFQYSYASQSFVFIAFLLAYRSLSQEKDVAGSAEITNSIRELGKIKPLNYPLVLILCFACTFSFTLSLREIAKLEFLTVNYHANIIKYQSMHQSLASLPRDKVTCTNNFLSTDLADIEELYDLNNNRSVMDGRPIEMLVLPKNFVEDNANIGTIEYLKTRNDLELSEEYSSSWVFVWLKSPE